MEEVNVTPDPNDVQSNKVMAILAYFGILFLIPLLAAKESPFARYHTNQGIVLFLFMFVCGILGVIPKFGWVISSVGYLAGFVFFIIGVINAAGGKMKPLPLIGNFTLIK
jgi:predicted membrane protein